MRTFEGGKPRTDGKLIAYFSAEYGLSECLPIYSGGLGVLSGDHLKSSSDCDLPLVGVGLLYQQGYFRQVLNPDGWQQERYPTNDFYTLPAIPVRDADGENLKVFVRLPTGKVMIQVWKMEVGRVTLYLLDTNIPENQLPQDRSITDSLYGGDTDTRMRQEFVLGVGGLRALKAVGLEPTVYHMNEGHSAFLALERMRVLKREHGLNFEEALQATRASNIFTTHTPVPAGIDLFDPGLMYHYFNAYCTDIGIEFDQLMALGRRNPANREERFSMAILALKTSAHRNAVSKLHREVSQEMWHDLWPQLPVWEVPVSSVTNGVHLTSWLNGDLAALYDQYLQPDWRDRFSDPEHLGAGQRDPGRRAAGGASPPQAPPGELRARAAALVGPAPAGFRRGNAAHRGGARSQRADHRLRAALRHLQARHAAVPRRGAHQAHPVQQGHAGADRDRRQGPSAG